MVGVAESAGRLFSLACTRSDCAVVLTGSTGYGSGGQVRVYGNTHATKASYVEFTRAATVSAYFDASGNLICNGTVTVPNGTAAAPGLRLTGEATGLYRINATKLGFAVGGIGALGLEKPGSGYGGGFQLLTQADADYTYIYSDRTNAEMRIAPGANSLDGANIRLFGNGHATPNRGSLRHSTTDKFTWNATGIGFFAAAPVAKPTVTGSRGGNAALASLLTALANFGLLTDSSS